jgi:hypothetical protein
MTPNLQKEFRTLAFPAGVILAALLGGAWATPGGGALFGYRDWLLQAAMTAFIVGIPLLAALPFGSEFQQKTMVLLLSAPVSRTRIWVDKWVAMVSVVTVLSGVEVLIVVNRGPGWDWEFLAVLQLLVMVVCSAPLWTLLTRSTLGGLAFTTTTIGMLELCATQLRYRATGLFPAVPFDGGPALEIVRGLYAAGTLYLGWRVFSRFQIAASGLGAASAGQAQTAWPVLRPRRSGAMSNLLRKELMLHRPTFQIAAVFTIGWIVSALLGASGMLSSTVAVLVPTMLAGFYMPLVVVLSGTLPVGEDTSLGTREWHLTLPVSARAQWFLKLLLAVAVVVLLGLLLPGVLNVGLNWLTHGNFGAPDMFRSSSFQLLIVCATLLAFWASTMFGDAGAVVKAAVATGAAAVAVGLCSALGLRLANAMPFHPAWWSPLTIRFQLPALYLQSVWLPRVCIGFALLTITAIGLRQSLSAFRRVRVTPLTAVRNAAVLFLVTLALMTFIFTTVKSVFSRDFAPSREVGEAVMRLPVPPDEKPGDPQRSVTLDELDRVRHLSPDTRRWLANATISIKRLPPTPMTTTIDGIRATPMYAVTVQFPNGLRDRFMAGRPR